MPFGALALRVRCHEVSSPSSVFFWRLNFFCGDHFTIEVELGALEMNWKWQAYSTCHQFPFASKSCLDCILAEPEEGCQRC